MTPEITLTFIGAIAFGIVMYLIFSGFQNRLSRKMTNLVDDAAGLMHEPFADKFPYAKIIYLVIFSPFLAFLTVVVHLIGLAAIPSLGMQQKSLGFPLPFIPFTKDNVEGFNTMNFLINCAVYALLIYLRSKFVSAQNRKGKI